MRINTGQILANRAFRGEVPVAFIVPKPTASVTEEEIMDLCRKDLAGFKCVKEVRFVQAIPKNATGKILKQQLRGQLAEQVLPGS
jgi:acyl-coenzyme A synthetase/AMP-(fatty) acid ligase